MASLGDAAGIFFRVHPEYSKGAVGPASVVVKFPAADPGQRGMADALGFYKRHLR
jgi:hypothetical protein